MGIDGIKSLVWKPIVVAVFLVLLASLLRIQLFQGDYFRALSDGNRVRRVPVHAARGIIYDRNGVPLTANLPSYRLKTCPDIGQCETGLISKSQAIELQSRGLSSGQSLELDSTRSYPYGPATAHLLGYVSPISAEELASRGDYLPGDVIGRGGLEQEYESRLRGKDGEEVVEVDALGKKLRILATRLPAVGQDIHTSIDITTQKIAYEQIKDRVGAVVATDPATGAVLAMVSSPSFDPNVFTDWSLPGDYRAIKIAALLSDASRPLFDRTIAGAYPAGSTFKIVTATAGLETGKITESTEITDPGILIIGPYKFPNWLYMRNGGTQGTLNVVSAIAKSNDIFFYRVGEWVGVEGLADWAAKFGLGNPLGIDLPGEVSGRIRSKPDWYLGDTYHLAIGQGDLLVTPLQVNRWTSVIANGGRLCQPRLARNEQLAMSNEQSIKNMQCKNVGISQKTIDLVRQGMVEACSPGGTAWPLFNFSTQIACKTGTAEYGDSNNRTHAWLTAYAPASAKAPAGKPEIAVTVLVEAGGEGSDVAAPMVKEILETWFTK